MRDERHLALKRWERARQLAALERDPVLSGPAALCRFPGETGEFRIPVFIVQIFPKDLACVKVCEDPPPPGMAGPFWLVRNGIQWEDYLPRIVDRYRYAASLPEPFRPRRKLAGDLVARLAALPGSALPEVFATLREAGLLPPLLPLTQSTCPACLPWDQLRSLFLDFKDSPRT